ncbi:MAG: DUF2784 family protein [Alphaproteobacteria bacterium]|nr:DUF2784 family protein [Alphaproteobacteria bacterium]
MSAAPEDDTPVLATAAPSPAEKRDLLGNFCFYLHFAIMLYIVGGWAIPWKPLLWFYLGFLPVVAAHWQINKNSCVLNNIESWLRHGTWRSEHNAEEGAWLMTLIRNLTGIALKAWQVDLLTYSVMAALWAGGLWHLRA